MAWPESLGSASVFLLLSQARLVGLERSCRGLRQSFDGAPIDRCQSLCYVLYNLQR